MPTRASKPDIDRDYVLETIGEDAIFAKYLGFGIDYKGNYCNPLRDDKSPGCQFYYNGYKTKFVDPAYRFNEDCFGVVMAQFNLTFGQAVRKVAEDFGLLDSKQVYQGIKREITPPPKDETIIRHKARSWTERDKTYWGNLYVGSTELTLFNTDSVGSLFTHSKGRDNFYNYRDSELCYAYREGEYTKIYRPEYPSHEGKFYNNLPKRYYHGYRQLPEQCDCLIITKSMKDVIVLYVLGYYAVAPVSENAIISLNGFHLLQAKTPYIYSLFDPDETGRECARIHQELYGIPPFYITSGEKDISGFISKKDYWEAKAFMDFHTQELKQKYYNDR